MTTYNDYLKNKMSASKEAYQGSDTYYTSDGKERIEVLEYRTYADVTARIVGTDFTFTTTMGAIKRGGVKNPFANNSPIAFENDAYKHNGCVYRTNEGCLIMIINYVKHKEVYYKFLDNGYIGCTTLQNIKNGEVRNPYSINEFGGYLGTNYKYRTMEYKWLYRIWYNILIRTNDSDYYNRYHSKNYKDSNIKPTTYYNDTIIDKKWLDFGAFADWYTSELEKKNKSYYVTYEVDKDCLYHLYARETNNTKMYSDRYCELIPKELNTALAEDKSVRESQELILSTGKINNIPESSRVKQTATQYHNMGCLSDRAYQAIMML